MMRLDGRIEDFDLFEVLQAALRRNEASQLLVADEQMEGSLRCNRGRLVEAKWGQTTGEQAVFAALARTHGFFSLAPARDEPAANAGLGWTWPQLLTEAFQRASVQAAETSEGPDYDLASLTGDLHILLQNLEADFAAIADAGAGAVELLEGLCDMANLAVSLAPDQTQRLKLRFEDVLPRHGWKGSSASFVRLEGQLIDGRTVREVYEAASFDPKFRAAEARSTAWTLSGALDDILSGWCQLVPDIEDQRNLKDRVRSLSTDLSALIRGAGFGAP
ncbi:MAG: DUF4388 domain-containing protein [Acidobacteriota bacterium]